MQRNGFFEDNTVGLKLSLRGEEVVLPREPVDGLLLVEIGKL